MSWDGAVGEGISGLPSAKNKKELAEIDKIYEAKIAERAADQRSEILRLVRQS